MENIRSFVAIELPQNLKDEMAELQLKLGKGKTGNVKWVDPESIHLTLKFLGGVPADRIETIFQALKELVLSQQLNYW